MYCYCNCNLTRVLCLVFLPLLQRIMRQPALLLHSRVRGTRKRAISYEYEAIMTWLTEHR